jgi:lipoprotein-releasing system permease protein
MFELSVACKYLTPRWRQLSVSIISLVSILVIALVVWLIVVFFSVKDGLEEGWIEKITALTAPIRITPTDKYYASYTHLIDSISAKSDYTTKTIGEKLSAINDSAEDPYDEESDEEIPSSWPKPILGADGQKINLVAALLRHVKDNPYAKHSKAIGFETTFANLHLRMVRKINTAGSTQQFIDQGAYIGSFDPTSRTLAKTLLPPSVEDISHLLAMQSTSSDNLLQEMPGAVHQVDRETLRRRLHAFFDAIAITALKVPDSGWRAPKQLMSIPGGTLLKATLVDSSIDRAGRVADLKFMVEGEVDGHSFKEEVPLSGLEIGAFTLDPSKGTSLFVQLANGPEIRLKGDDSIGEPILLPKGYRKGGALLGDQGYIAYHSPTPGALQEMRAPVYVAGFYDPGIMPIGNKYILAGNGLISTIRASYDGQDGLAGSGINFSFDNISDAKQIKRELQGALAKDGILPYWTIETYHEYEFTKDLIEQLESEKNLFGVISLVIIIVACSNIISMLIILVNDKKLEIGILRSLGATSYSIAAIFGLCGIVMGTLGSVIGIVAALLTLHNLNTLVAWIGSIQGHDLFNPTFYGDTLPTTLSTEALALVILATACISLLAGIVPAIKACLIRPSAILRSE